MRARVVAWVIIVAAAFMGSPAHATTVALSPPSNLSDHWWVPDESGWGLSIVQHDDRLLFGTLFVYAEGGRARWFVMPEMRRGEGVAPVYSGALYSASGSPIGTPFDPASTRLQQRGVATLTPLNDGTAQLRYSVDGATVDKLIRRLDVMGAPINGTFTVRLAASSVSACSNQSLPDRETWRIRLLPAGYEISRLPLGGTPGNPQPLQVEQHGSAVIASFAEPQSPARGTWALVLDSVTGYAFTGKFSFVADAPAGGCVIQGSISGVRDFPAQVPGRLSDLWFDPSQPGWGMFVSHGDLGLFTALFLYSSDVRDAQGQGLAEWYVIPEMRALPFPGGAVPDPPPPPPGYTGTLYSAQGSPFAQRFDAAATRLVPVGEATLGEFGVNDATLTYRIGAQTVSRRVQRLETAALPVAGRYRVAMTSYISACGVRETLSETWDVERAVDGAYFLSRTDAAGAAIGSRVPAQVVQRGKLAEIRFTSPQGGAAYSWQVGLESTGAGGIGGAYSRQLPDNSCYENGTLAGARVQSQ